MSICHLQATNAYFSEGSAYVRAFNWALPTLLATVMGDVVATNNGEVAYAVINLFLGIAVNAIIIGNVALVGQRGCVCVCVLRDGSSLNVG